MSAALAAFDPACYRPSLSYANLELSREAVAPAESQHFSLLVFVSWWTVSILESHRDCWKGQTVVFLTDFDPEE